jgi:hypothetical protein
MPKSGINGTVNKIINPETRSVAAMTSPTRKGTTEAMNNCGTNLAKYGCRAKSPFVSKFDVDPVLLAKAIRLSSLKRARKIFSRSSLMIRELILAEIISVKKSKALLVPIIIDKNIVHSINCPGAKCS